MDKPEFALQALFFIVNSFALCFLVCLVTRTVKRMEKKLDSTLNFMRWVKSRNDTTYLDMLYRIQSILVQQEKYEEAGRVKRIIDEELQTLNEKGE